MKELQELKEILSGEEIEKKLPLTGEESCDDQPYNGLIGEGTFD